MPSGIYRLTFESGKYYVGKSLDIDTRWKQHFNKFALGKAARPMQLEYDSCGLPQTEIVFECHRDHIDILEEWIIDQLKGPDMLNTTYPDLVRTKEVRDLIENNRDLLKLSTWDHLKLIYNHTQATNSDKQKAQKALELVKAYRSRGRIIDEDYIELVKTTQHCYNKLEESLELLEFREYELFRLSKMSLWDRIFNYKVYV